MASTLILMAVLLPALKSALKLAAVKHLLYTLHELRAVNSIAWLKSATLNDSVRRNFIRSLVSEPITANIDRVKEQNPLILDDLPAAPDSNSCFTR